MDVFSALFQALFIILFVGGLALLSHWGRKNRGAEISLVVILLALSSLVLVTGVLVAVVWLAGLVPPELVPPTLSASASVVILLAGVIGIVLCVPPLRGITGRRRAETGAAASTSRDGWWSDPPIYFALWIFVVVLAERIVELLLFALAPEQVESAFEATGKLSPLAVVLTQLPFVVIAVLGVGFGVSRDFRQTVSRLGYGRITLPQLGIVALFVAGAFVLEIAFDALFQALQPDLYERVGRISEGLFGTEGFGLTAAILFALLIGLGAALGEETIFRGAMQPALGITLTSLLWASLHVQYGPSVVLVYIFVLSIGLGILRNRINTTATFLAHAGYNASGVLLAYFFG